MHVFLAPPDPLVGLGDSKTANDAVFVAALVANIGVTRVQWAGQLAAPSWTATDLRNGVDAWIPTVGRPKYALVNIGINDASLNTPQATYEADLGYTLDAMHTAWPAARLFVAIPWGRNYDAKCDTIAGWISNVLATRGPWAAVGIDERATPGLKNGDNGVTYTSDGIHPNAAGFTDIWAPQWQTVMGY